MTRRSKQLGVEIAAALAKGSPHPEATARDWKKLVEDIKKRFHAAIHEQQKALLQEEYKAARQGLRAAEQVAALKPTYVTDTNLFALKSLVVQHVGPEFPSRLPAVDAPHIKRCLAAGLVEVAGNKVRLTPGGRAAVADALVKDLERERRWTPRENTAVAPEKRAEVLARDVAEHDRKIRRFEETLAKIV